MSWPAVLPDAARRVPRSVAGRRVLLGVLLVGVVFVLGLFLGQRAQAADGGAGARVPTAAEAAGEAGQARPGRGVSALLGGGSGGGVSDVVGTVAGRGDTAGGGAAEQTDVLSPRAPQAPPSQSTPPQSTPPKPMPSKPSSAPRAPSDPAPPSDSAGPAQPPAPGLPSLPDLPALPIPADDLPTLPTLPALPLPADLPVLSDLPILSGLLGGSTLPGLPELPASPVPPDGIEVPVGIAVPAELLPAPVGSGEGDGPVVPPHGEADSSTVSPSPAAASVARGRDGAPSGTAGVTGPVGVRGMAYSGTSDARRPAAGGPAADGGRAAAPVPHAPAGDPDGTLDASTAADHGTPRHADASAVALSTRVPLGLAVGSVVDTDASDLRDRYRDVLVSPA